MTRFLICGLGSIGRRHLRNLIALGQDDIVLYRTREATLPDDELGGHPVETDLRVALDRWKPDAVLVTNPTALHLEVAIPAARTGADLLIEKPVSHTMEGVDNLIDAVRVGGGQVLVGYQFRFHPGLKKAKELLEGDAIGKPISARAHWGEYLPHWHPWEDYRRSYSASSELGGGVILTLSHPLDYLGWLLGEVSGLQASIPAVQQLGLEVEEAAEILLRHQSGALSSVHLDYNQRPPRHDLEIIGSRGTLRWSNGDGAVQIWRVEIEHWDQFDPPNGYERNDMFLEEIRHFVHMIAGTENPMCTLDDGIRALQVALEAKVGATRSEESRSKKEFRK